MSGRGSTRHSAIIAISTKVEGYFHLFSGSPIHGGKRLLFSQLKWGVACFMSSFHKQTQNILWTTPCTGFWYFLWLKIVMYLENRQLQLSSFCLASAIVPCHRDHFSNPRVPFLLWMSIFGIAKPNFANSQTWTYIISYVPLAKGFHYYLSDIFKLLVGMLK